MNTNAVEGFPRVPSPGFTIMELMVTVAIVAVLLGLALPDYRDVIIGNNVSQTTNALVRDLSLARTEAVRRGTLVAVISNSGNDDWSSGWYVQTDGKYLADGTFTAMPVPAADPDVVLSTHPGVRAASHYSVRTAVVALSGTGITPQSGRVIFTAQGNLIALAASFDINVCRPDSNAQRSKRITIAGSGMIATQTGTTSSPAPAC